jgi:hypothetical protein
MDPYSLMADGAKRYKNIVEEHDPNYMENDLWWFIDGLETGCRHRMNRTIMHIWIGYIIGQLVARGWAELDVERRLVRKSLRLVDTEKYGRPPGRE